MEFSESGEAELEPRLRFSEFRNVKVEWKALGDVAKYQQPTKYLVESTNYNDKFSIPVVKAGKTFILGYTDETEGVYKASVNPVIIFDDFTTSNKWVNFDFKAKSSAMKIITSIDNSCYLQKYIYYWLNTLSMEGISGDHKRQWISNFARKKIPIPPLAIQVEIVRILDKFTELISELKNELKARKKQYSYYREQLFSFQKGSVEWKMLAEVGKLVRGNGLQKKDFTEVGVPAIHYGQIYTYYGTFATETKSYVSPELAKTLKKIDTGDVVITNTSENVADVGKAMCYLGQLQAVTGGHATIFKPCEYVLGKYLAYFTQVSVFASQKRKYAKGTKVIDVSATDMAKIKIPVPSLANQRRIISTLDKFDALINLIIEEIELRQQQYKHYRELLLNFPKVEKA